MGDLTRKEHTLTTVKLQVLKSWTKGHARRDGAKGHVVVAERARERQKREIERGKRDTGFTTFHQEEFKRARFTNVHL